MRNALSPVVAALSLSLLSLLAACPASPGDRPADLAVTPPPDGPATVGLFQDCTPSGWSDVRCASGLRCGLIQLGDPPSQGSLAQCVPVADKPLGLNDACQFDQGGAPPSGQSGPNRYYDRCGPGLGCVQTETAGLRCRKLCLLRNRSACGKELCVLPTQVTGTGYCAAPDGCQPEFPQTGCGAGLGCYVLTDDKGGGTLCLRQKSYGDSTGALDSACERSVNCQPGLACTTISGKDSACRPYCTLPVVPDGGTPPDLGPGGTVRCANDLGTCQPIVGGEPYGRCL